MTVNATDRATSAVLMRDPASAKAPNDVAREQVVAVKQAAETKEAQKAPPPPAAAAASSNTNLRFSVDKDSGKTVVAWVDDQGKVLKQMPSEEALAVAKAIDRYQGVFLNRKA